MTLDDKLAMADLLLDILSGHPTAPQGQHDARMDLRGGRVPRVHRACKGRDRLPRLRYTTSMKFCMPHWNSLRQAIEDRGLGNLVAKGGEALTNKIQAEIDAGDVTQGSFDPLLGAHNAIIGNLLSVVGVDLLYNNEDGSDRCPLCYAVDNCACGKGEACEFRTWINHAADDALAQAKELGLIGES